jgi:hypothetical protein
MTKARDLANGGFGLILVKPSSVVGGTDNGKGTVSFSASTGVSLNDVFSSTYDNYLISTTISSVSTDGYLQLRLRVAGSDNTGGTSYSTAGDTITPGAARGPFGDGATSFFYLCELDGASNGYFYKVDINMSNPFLAQPTTATTQWSDRNLSTVHRGGYSGLLHNVSTSYTGISLLASNGNMSGKVSVYGYNQ